MVRLRLLALMLIVAILAAACSGNATNTPAANPTSDSGGSSAAGDPTDAVRGFYAAVYTGGEADPYVCAAAPQFADAVEQGAQQSAAVFANATINLDGLTYTVSEQADTTATVTVEGQILYSISGVDTPVPFGPMPHQVVLENGSWKVCG